MNQTAVVKLVITSIVSVVIVFVVAMIMLAVFAFVGWGATSIIGLFIPLSLGFWEVVGVGVGTMIIIRLVFDLKTAKWKSG